MVLGVESDRVVWANPEEDESPIASPRRHNLSVLSVPSDLAAQPGSVLVQDPVDVTGPWCQCSILLSICPISLWIEPAPKYEIEITLPDIEYVKSATAG